MRKSGLTVAPIKIMQSGVATGGVYFGMSVPKDEMASSLMLLFQADRLKIGDTPETDELTNELQNYSPKPSSIIGKDLEAWRERPSDDLVFAMMMPCWFGERRLHSILRLPPMPRAPVETRQPTLDELLELQPKPDSDQISRI